MVWKCMLVNEGHSRRTAGAYTAPLQKEAQTAGMHVDPKSKHFDLKLTCQDRILRQIIRTYDCRHGSTLCQYGVNLVRLELHEEKKRERVREGILAGPFTSTVRVVLHWR